MYMGVSENGGSPPHIIHFNRVFHYKPSIFGVPLFLKTPIYSYATFVMGDLKGSHLTHLFVFQRFVFESSRILAEMSQLSQIHVLSENKKIRLD